MISDVDIRLLLGLSDPASVPANSVEPVTEREPLAPGLTATIERHVTDEDTAIALGSGAVPVLGTPRLIAWCEAATVEAVQRMLDAGTTTVGTSVNVDHIAPTPVGETIQATAALDRIDGRILRFTVTALHGDTPIARGTISRAVVDIERFLARLID